MLVIGHAQGQCQRSRTRDAGQTGCASRPFVRRAESERLCHHPTSNGQQYREGSTGKSSWSRPATEWIARAALSLLAVQPWPGLLLRVGGWWMGAGVQPPPVVLSF